MRVFSFFEQSEYKEDAASREIFYTPIGCSPLPFLFIYKADRPIALTGVGMPTSFLTAFSLLAMLP